ncbi:hypothetical protein Gpo141_00011703 [Globisporangium polare]
MEAKMNGDKTTTLLHASTIPVTPGVACFDAQGIQLFEWSHPLKSSQDRCGQATEERYVWFGCFALAQIESRVGITTFGNSLASSLPLSVLSAVFGFILQVYVVFWSELSTVEAVRFTLAVIAFLCVCSLMWLRRTSKARTFVRERFQIPGSKGDDRSVAFWHSSRMLRQMVRHLNCEDAGAFERVDTLPASTQ